MGLILLWLIGIPIPLLILIALLAKQLGVQPTGWRAAAGDYALKGYRSVADVVGPESLLKVREYKQQKKQAAATR